MHVSPTAQPEPAGAAWRQQALRVVRRTPDAALSTMPLGAVELLADRTFAQHGVLGDPHSLVVAFAILNRGAEVAPLATVEVSFAVPGVTFGEDGAAIAGWQDGLGWTHAVERTRRGAQVTLSSSALLRDGAVTGATFRLGLRPDVDLSQTPLTLTATGHAETYRPAAPSALNVPVERVSF